MSYSKAAAGTKRKAGDAWKPFLNRSQPTSTSEINAKYMNTPHRMAEVGWLPHWELREGMRELIANMIDQARTVADKSFSPQTPLEFTEEPGRFLVHIGTNLLAEANMGYKMRKFIRSYYNGGCVKAKAVASDVTTEETQVIELINYSSVLPWTSFHVGHSTKRDNKSVIGKHGEGLTGACVVLNRAGCNVIADCTHNQYAAHVVKLSRDVCFQLKRREARKKDLPDNTVRFTIVFDPSKPEVDLEELMSSVRLPTAAAEAGIATPRGTLLLEKSLRGKQFNRSIFVGEDPSCLFGYDFHDPDKDLLQGRDRNAHGKQQCLNECGQILSHAILDSEDVRKEVLTCFVFGANYNPNGAGVTALKKYEDIRDGEYLSAQAIRALREQCEANQPGNQKVVFCARSTGLLDEIKRVRRMTSVFTHQILHNHHDVVSSFRIALTRGAHAIDPSTRVGSVAVEIQRLLGVTAVMQSTMQDDHEVDPETGFWIVDGYAFVTNVHALGSSDASGLSETQEISLFRSLQFANVSVETQVKMMRLLRNQPENTEDNPASAENRPKSPTKSAAKPPTKAAAEERERPKSPEKEDTTSRRRTKTHPKDREDREDASKALPWYQFPREKLVSMISRHFQSRPFAERVQFFAQTHGNVPVDVASVLVRNVQDSPQRLPPPVVEVSPAPPHVLSDDCCQPKSPPTPADTELDDDATQCSRAEDCDMTQVDNGDDDSVASGVSHRAVSPASAEVTTEQEETQVSDGESVISNDDEAMSIVSSVASDGSIAVGLKEDEAFDLGSDAEEETEHDDYEACPKRRKLIYAAECAPSTTSSANTSLEVTDLSTDCVSVASDAMSTGSRPSVLLPDLPEKIVLGAGRSHVTKILRH